MKVVLLGVIFIIQFRSQMASDKLIKGRFLVSSLSSRVVKKIDRMWYPVASQKAKKNTRGGCFIYARKEWKLLAWLGGQAAW